TLNPRRLGGLLKCLHCNGDRLLDNPFTLFPLWAILVGDKARTQVAHQVFLRLSQVYDLRILKDRSGGRQVTERSGEVSVLAFLHSLGEELQPMCVLLGVALSQSCSQPLRSVIRDAKQRCSRPRAY